LGGGGTPLYQVYRYVPPQTVWFLSHFGLKTGIEFEHFGLKLGMFMGRMFMKAYKLIFLPNKNEGSPCSFRSNSTLFIPYKSL